MSTHTDGATVVVGILHRSFGGMREKSGRSLWLELVGSRCTQCRYTGRCSVLFSLLEVGTCETPTSPRSAKEKWGQWGRRQWCRRAPSDAQVSEGLIKWIVGVSQRRGGWKKGDLGGMRVCRLALLFTREEPEEKSWSFHNGEALMRESRSVEARVFGGELLEQQRYESNNQIDTNPFFLPPFYLIYWTWWSG